MFELQRSELVGAVKTCRQVCKGEFGSNTSQYYYQHLTFESGLTKALGIAELAEDPVHSSCLEFCDAPLRPKAVH